MKFHTIRFGEVDIEEDRIITIKEGPHGFPRCTKWAFMPEDRAEPFKMFQSLDNASLAFVTIAASFVRRDFHINVPEDTLKALKADSVDGMEVFCICCMAKEACDITVNLMGPVVFNPNTNLAEQVITEDSPYTAREKLLLPDRRSKQ